MVTNDGSVAFKRRNILVLPEIIFSLKLKMANIGLWSFTSASYEARIS